MSKDKTDVIKKFDKMLIESGEYSSIIRRFPAYAFEGIGFMFIMVVSAMNDRAAFLGVAYFAAAITMHLNIYMVIAEKNKSTSVYDMLQYFPVSPWDIYKVRLEYLIKMLGKRLLIMWILQVPMVVYEGKGIVWSIFFPILVVITAAVISAWFMLPVGKEINIT